MFRTDREFQAIIGYLALNQKDRTFAQLYLGHGKAFPRRTIIPKGRRLGAKVAVPSRAFRNTTSAKNDDGVPQHRGVPADRRPCPARDRNCAIRKREKVDVEAIRKTWTIERRKTRKQEPVIDNRFLATEKNEVIKG